jgi:hypothetical protein
MKITNANLLCLAGLSALLAGLCYVLVGLLHPENVSSAVTTTRWATAHVLACAMSFFGVLGLAGLYARQAVKSGWLGLIGFVLLSLWMVVIMGFSFVEAFILPRGAAVLLALGTVLAPVASQLSLAWQPKIAIPVGLALAWMGYALCTERATQLSPTDTQPMDATV